MKAIVKRLYADDFEPLESVDISDPTCFELNVCVMVGPVATSGEESFDITVCTPGWLMLECERRHVVWGRNYLVVDTYNVATIKETIQRKVDSIGADTWEEFAHKLGRWARWEFEDYKPRV